MVANINTDINNQSFPNSFHLDLTYSRFNLNFSFVQSNGFMKSLLDTNVYLQDSTNVLAKNFSNPLVRIIFKIFQAYSQEFIFKEVYAL
jgi:hypothetical protein